MRNHEEVIRTKIMQATARDWADAEFRSRFGYPDSVGEAGEKMLALTITPAELESALNTIDAIQDEWFKEENA